MESLRSGLFAKRGDVSLFEPTHFRLRFPAAPGLIDNQERGRVGAARVPGLNQLAHLIKERSVVSRIRGWMRAAWLRSGGDFS